MRTQDRMGDDSMDNLPPIREIDYTQLHQAITSEDIVVRKSARFSGQISYYDKNGIYTDYIIASEATADGIFMSFANDGISITFIEESDRTLSLADSIWASKNNQKIVTATSGVGKQVSDIMRQISE